MEIIKWIYKVNKKRLENLKNEQEGSQMKILDIFSWVPEMIKEGKRVAFIIKECKIVALIGYQE